MRDPWARPGGVEARHGTAMGVVAALTARPGLALRPQPASEHIHHAAAKPLRQASPQRWDEMLRALRLEVVDRHRHSLARHGSLMAFFIGLRPVADDRTAAWGTPVRYGDSLANVSHIAAALAATRRQRYRAAGVPAPGRHTDLPPDPPPDPPPEHPPVVVPIKRIYIVMHDVFLRRVSDNAPIHCVSMSLSLDASSWAWGFDASVAASSQALVEPDANGPVELLASVNGKAFRVLAEQVSRERVFGQTRIRVSGRSRHAALDAPYSPQQVFGHDQPRTSQQLMDDVLTVNGVPLGYTVDYGLAPWLVPAGVFSHQGTYISALAALAQAGGGYLIPHASERAFKVRHRYPFKPWEPITPDVVLPADVLVRESIAWKERPAYNRVYVSGQAQGVLGRVTRAGTAGDVLAPMVTDALITDAVAARQRGLAVLGDTGRQLELGISLPVLPEIGVIEPGTYVRYADGAVTRIGIVRSTAVQVGGAEVNQTLGVEVHV